MKRDRANLDILVLLAGLVFLVSWGCHKVNSANPQVILANNLLSAADATDLVADGLVAANQVVESLQTTEPDYYGKAKPLLQRLAHLNDNAIAAVRSAKAGAATDWKGALLAIAKEAQTFDLTSFGFKNPNSQAVVKIGMASLVTVLQSIPASFGGTSGGTQ